jgi:hypothetical protein
MSYDEAERRTRATVLRHEAGSKLKNWRKEAVLDVVGRDATGEKVPGTRDLIQVQFLVDQHFENVYFKLDVLAARVAVMPWLLGALIVLVVAVAFTKDFILGGGATPDASILNDYVMTIAVAVLGAAGATLSRALSALGMEDRIPQVLSGATEWTVRPMIGALSAIAVVLVLESGLLPINEPAEPMIYAYAIAAGLTDRLLNRVLKAVEASTEK